MSLASLALRAATVKLLRNATYAGERVGDSTIDPVNFLKEPTPFIIVAVDSFQAETQGSDLLGASKSITLILDMGVGSRIEIKKGEGEDEIQLGIPHTDAGMEVTLDLMARQVQRAFVASTGPWADVWRTLVVKVEKVQADRGATTENGVRVAARQVMFTLQVMHEPSFGQPEGVWADIVALMRADPELEEIAELVEAEIASPNLEGWSRAIADLGLRDGYSLGGEPLLEPPEEALTGIAVEHGGGTWPVDQQTIDDALGPEQPEEG